MSMKYSELKKNLPLGSDSKEVKLPNGKIINVIQYLPIDKKKEIVEAIKAKVFLKGYTDMVDYDVLFIINIIKYYTDISFTKAELTNIYSTYDYFVNSKIFEEVVKAMPELEFKGLQSFIRTQIDDELNFRYSAKSAIIELVDSIRGLLGDLSGAMESFDPSKFATLTNILTSIENPSIVQDEENIDTE